MTPPLHFFFFLPLFLSLLPLLLILFSYVLSCHLLFSGERMPLDFPPLAPLLTLTSPPPSIIPLLFCTITTHAIQLNLV